MCLDGWHVIAQTQGYHLVCIWGSLAQFQGGDVLKFDVSPHCYAVFCAVCMQAMTHSVSNGPSQQAVKLMVVGPVLLSTVGLDCFWETSGNEKWDELGKWLCNR